MKKLKFSILALTFAVGIIGAIAEKTLAKPKIADQVYSWTAAGQPPFIGTTAQAMANYGCTDGPLICAIGTSPGVPNNVLHRP